MINKNPAYDLLESVPDDKPKDVGEEAFLEFLDMISDVLFSNVEICLEAILRSAEDTAVVFPESSAKLCCDWIEANKDRALQILAGKQGHM